MAYRYKKKKAYRSRKMTIPAAVALPVAMRVIGTGKDIMAGKYDEASYVLTGCKPGQKFDMGRVLTTWSPVLAGIVVHKAANIVGLNRMLAQHKIPLIRV